MSIFTTNAPVDAATAAAKQVDTIGQTLLQQNLRMYTAAFNTFWKNPNATPAQIAAVWGTGAMARFAAHKAIGDAILTAAPNTVLPAPPYQYTLNADGSITIGDPIS